MESFEFIESGLVFGLNSIERLKKFKHVSSDFAKHSDAYKFLTEHVDTYGEFPSADLMVENFPVLDTSARDLNLDYALDKFKQQVLFRQIVTAFQSNKDLLRDNPKKALGMIMDDLNDVEILHDEDVNQYDNGGAFDADGNFTWNSGTQVLTVSGHIAATTKSFLIDHPTKPEKQLQYACLEGPENGVYVRGHTNDNLIDLPDYWTALVDPESITVQLTAKDAPQPFLYVSGVLNNQVHLISDREISAYYTVSATRKDVDPLLVEPDNY